MANVNVAGDCASLQYTDSCGNVEKGLKVMLERIYGHLDKLYDEMMARSLKRRAVFLSECIQAEIVRQADLMLQLSRLDEVLERKLTRMKSDCLEGTSSSAGHGDTTEHGDQTEGGEGEGGGGYEEDPIEDCDEALEQEQIHSANRREDNIIKVEAGHDDDGDDEDEPKQELYPESKPQLETVREDSSVREKSVKIVEAKSIGKEDSVAQQKSSDQSRNEPQQKSGMIVPSVCANAEGVPAGQATYAPFYLNPSCLTYAYTNPTNVMYLGKNGTTIDSNQMTSTIANNYQTPYTTFSPIVGTADAYAAAHNYTSAPVCSAYPSSVMTQANHSSHTQAEHYADGKSQTFNINGVPVNGLLFNLPEQTMNQSGGLTGSGDYGTSSYNYYSPLMNNNNNAAVYSNQQHQHQQQHHQHQQQQQQVYQYHHQPVQQSQQNYNPYNYPMYGYYPSYY